MKNIEAHVGHLVQAFKEKFSRISHSNTSTNPNECMDTPLRNMQELPILKSVEEIENELEIEKKALLNNLEDEEPKVDELKVEINTFTFSMDLVTWGIEGDLQNSYILRRPLPTSSQAWIDINKGELTLLVGEEKEKFNLNQPLPLMEQEIKMYRKICSLLPSKGHMFEKSPLIKDVFALESHKGDYFEEIVVEPLATIKGDFQFLSPIQNLEENIIKLNGYEE